MNPYPDPIGLLYDNDGYVDAASPSLALGAERHTGPIGRKVAGKEFLDAFFTYGTWTKLVALVRDQNNADTLTRYFQSHPANRGSQRDLRVVPERDFLQAYFPAAPAGVLYTPCPPDLRFAWARSYKRPGAFSLSGVTHTLCSQRAFDWLCELVTGPFEPYDSLICTSQSVLNMVRAVTGAYADFLSDRIGGAPQVRMRLEVIPLGVDTQKFRQTTAEERALSRETLGVDYDEIAVLYVGRFAHHAKAHPLPIYHSVAEAARATGRKIHLLMCGWATNQAVMQAFRDGARAFAPNVRVTFVDGALPAMRSAVWQAADLFTSLVDNLQETFGLTIGEAMASGLPVIATDWNGYRDLVVHGETGLLVPTYMIPGATVDATARLQLEATDYNLFLAETSQAVAVDCGLAADAFVKLIGDEALRHQMGAAGRQRALKRFDWSHIIRAYEDLWISQEQQRQECCRRQTPRPTWTGPARYPAPEHAFAGYPTTWLRDDDLLLATDGATEKVEMLVNMPLVNHVAATRVADLQILRAVLAAADARPLRQVEEVLTQRGVDRSTARATLAWMLKYHLLRITSLQIAAIRRESP